MGRRTMNIPVFKADRAAGGMVESADIVDERRLACAVGADQADDFAARHGHVHAGKRL